MEMKDDVVSLDIQILAIDVFLISIMGFVMKQANTNALEHSKYPMIKVSMYE